MPTTVEAPPAAPPDYLTPRQIHQKHPQYSEWLIRELVRAGVVECNRGPRNQMRFRPEQEDALLKALAAHSAGRDVRAATPKSRLRQRAA
jgi:hypothetical protein